MNKPVLDFSYIVQGSLGTYTICAPQPTEDESILYMEGLAWSSQKFQMKASLRLLCNGEQIGEFDFTPKEH